MIDHFLKWTNEAAAIAAAEEAGKEKLGSRDGQGNWQWNKDYVLPGLLGWRISHDTIGPNGEVIHQYIAGWSCIVALQKPNQKIINDPAMQFVLDRNGPPYVLANNVGSLKDFGCEPMFAGSHYPLAGIDSRQIFVQPISTAPPVLSAPTGSMDTAKKFIFVQPIATAPPVLGVPTL